MTTEKSKPDTQNARILHYLEQGNTLTPMEAFFMFKSLRLGARIFNLREKGHNIITERHPDGYAIYSLKVGK